MPSAVIIIHVASRDRRCERRRNAELVSKQALLKRCFSSVTVAASAILPELLYLAEVLEQSVQYKI